MIMNTSTVYVLGHKHPDTDSICSAIGYAAYLNRNGGTRYVPARCGNLNAETKYALQKFGVEAPSLILNVEPSVADLKTIHPEHALHSTPTFDVIEMMDKNDLRNLPITDDDGRLLGLISEHGLARAYVSNTKMETLAVSPIAVDDLARILHGKVFVKSQDVLEGTVYISIDALHVILSRITHKDIAVVGDDEPTQLTLISAGIAALIIADSAPIGDRVVTAAKEHGVTLIGTAADAFGTAKMIHMTLPARSIMTTDVPTVRIGDTLEYVKGVVSSSPYRAACILDAQGKFVGGVSRNSLMEDIAKSVILLDHNEYRQAGDGIETADVVEIIDHHRLGAMSTLKPISFSMEPLGSTSTIISRRYLESGTLPSKAIAGVLLSGILSDTLGLKMSTTTDIDRHIAARLAEIADVDIEAYSAELIVEGMALAGVSQGELQER
ncbi:MAG TPA: putative manganese-dependent inorganic diphosphatase, partial [Methanocorpusculum sp.]|nr:putative manganese-dependent inorganic diphosphatase [Methanocorpusculum sp.]